MFQGEQLILQNPQTSVKQSVEFLKKLTVVAISCISYLRNIFPPPAFSERKLNGVVVRIIKGDENIPGTQKLIHWIKSAFDAVQLHCVSSLILLRIQMIKNNHDGRLVFISEIIFFPVYLFMFEYTYLNKYFSNIYQVSNL